MASTIRDVAKKAGVAISTASLVINDRPNVNPETKERVLQAIRELDFHPRRHARALASQKTGNIGFILTEEHFSLAEPFYTKIFLGTEFESRKFNYYILLTTVPSSFRVESDLPRFLRERNVDGILFAGRVPLALAQHVRELGLPHVFIDFSPRHKTSNVVMMDNLIGATQAVRHLLALGHRQIAFIGGDISHPSIASRREGYQQTMAQARLPVSTEYISCEEKDTGNVDGQHAVQKLVDRRVPYSAIFAANDAMAIGAMQVLQEIGRKIPAEISLVGFDDIEACILVQPSLTTVRVDKEELGAIATRRLVEMIETKKELSGKVFSPVELVVRQSTAAPAVFL
ncbi:MAG: LacI family DNA-binding transcriptional regulator [bacterium]